MPPFVCPVCQRAVTSRLFELRGGPVHADCLDLWLPGQLRNVPLPLGTDQTPEQTAQIRRLVDVFERSQVHEALNLRARVARRMEVARA